MAEKIHKDRFITIFRILLKKFDLVDAITRIFLSVDKPFKLQLLGMICV